MTLMCTCDDIRDYFASRCDPRKFTPWIAELKGNLDKLLKGVHRDDTSKCQKTSDARYPSVSAFVASMTAYYVNL